MKRLFLLLALGWCGVFIGCVAESTTSTDASEDTPEIVVSTGGAEAETRLVSLNVPNMT